jgi:hypothetical protein
MTGSNGVGVSSFMRIQRLTHDPVSYNYFFFWVGFFAGFFAIRSHLPSTILMARSTTIKRSPVRRMACQESGPSNAADVARPARTA